MCNTASSPYIRKSRLLRFLSPMWGREPTASEVVPLEATLISNFVIFSNPTPSSIIFINKKEMSFSEIYSEISENRRKTK